MIIGVISPKGGVGKTTIASNIAVVLSQGGARTLLADADYQTSLSKWHQLRTFSKIAPHIECNTMEGKIGSDLVKAQKDFDYVVVDAGGRDTLEMRQAIAVCDKIIVPLRPSILDVMEMAAMAAITDEVEQATQKDIVTLALLNSVSTNPRNTDVAETRAVIRDNPQLQKRFPILHTTLGNRVAFSRSMRIGAGVTDLKDTDLDLKANSEMHGLIKELLFMGKRK